MGELLTSISYFKIYFKKIERKYKGKQNKIENKEK